MKGKPFTNTTGLLHVPLKQMHINIFTLHWIRTRLPKIFNRIYRLIYKCRKVLKILQLNESTIYAV